MTAVLLVCALVIAVVEVTNRLTAWADARDARRFTASLARALDDLRAAERNRGGRL